MEIPKKKKECLDFLSNINRIMRSEAYHMVETNEVIQRESESEYVQKCSREAQESGKKIISMINDIIAYTSIREGIKEIESERYELRDVLQELLGMGKSFSREYGVEFTLEANEELPGVLYGADRGIVQVLVHLLENVMRYTSTSGVRMTVTQLDQREDEVLLTAVIMDQASIAAYDGTGTFKMKDIEDGNRQERSLDLAGMGLVVAQRLSDHIGGTLAICNIRGAGYYEFTMWQKLEKGQFLGDWSQLEKEEGQEKQWNLYAPECRILMADSNPANCQIVSSLLKRSGIQVDSCQTGQECLAKATRARYHMIFLDCDMPDINGEKLLWFLREIMRIQVPIIAMEDQIDVNTEKYYIDRGFSGALQHPVTWYHFQRLLLKYLPGELVQKTERRQNGLDAEKINQLAAQVEKLGIELPVGLKYVAGDIHQYRRMAELLSQDAGQQMADILEHIKSGQYDIVDAIFRNVAGKAKALGAIELYSTIMVIERRGKAGDQEYVDTTMPVLYLLWNRVIKGLEYILEETQQYERRSGSQTGDMGQEGCEQQEGVTESTEELMEHALYYIANLYPKKARRTLRLLKKGVPEDAELLDQVMTKVGNFEYDDALILLERWREECWKHGKRQNSCD